MKKKVTLKGLWKVLKCSFKSFGPDKITKKSASLSYYTVFSIGPMLIVIIFAAGLFFGREAVEGTVYGQIKSFVGSDAAIQIQQMIKNASINGKKDFAAVIGIIALLIGATTIFSDMQDSINDIWGLKPNPKKGIMQMVFSRILSFGVIGSLAFLLLVSLVISTLMDRFSARIQSQFPDLSVGFLYIINLAITFSVITVLFGIIFKVLPDAKIKWVDVLSGSIATALLFMLGKFGISYYISSSNISDSYGAAGSLVILLLWIYYSSIILYFGAEFTKEFALEYGHDIQPNSYAVFAKKVEIDLGKTSIQEGHRELEKKKEENSDTIKD
ncbi:MAG: YihY/virulence factor BrkB family protein [Ginsengibacter sp.]